MASKGDDVKLLGAWASPFVMRPRIALNIKSVDYEFLEETFGSKSDLLLKSNPVHKKIPVLLHNNKPVCESLIIVNYIDETWSDHLPSILPSDPYHRAVARFWASFIDDQWAPSFFSLRRLKTDEERATALEKVGSGLVVLDGAFHECSEGKEFFGGESVGFVDIALGSFLGWIRVIETLYNVKLIYENKTPQLAAWAERFCGHDSVKKVMPETQKLLEFSKVILAKVSGTVAKD